MNHLDKLEEKSIYLIRESYYHFKGRIAMLWSVGKDSTVMLSLVRKAFGGVVPFPLIHIDTSYKIPEMIQFRDQVVRDLRLDMIVGSNQEAIRSKKTFPEQSVTRLECCHLLKTKTLELTFKAQAERLRFNHDLKTYEVDTSGEIFDALLLGIRSDEEGTRSKERYFSIRKEDNSWEIENMPAEIWDEFNVELSHGQSIRIHPILDWSEKNIWEYIKREGISVTELYFNQGAGSRYRSLGCWPCTKKIISAAKTVDEIISEITTGEFSRIAERSGRDQDKENGNTLEALRRKGYM